jgi:AraC-like DNA-binding protein
MRRATDLSAELDEPGPGAREAAIAHLTLLVVAAARLAQAVSGEEPARDDPVLRRVFALIDERFEERLSLRQVADAVGLTPAYLTTLVRRRTGRTVQSWILERRLAEARRLLARTDQSVAQIGAAVGFPDSPYFVRTFRREHGTTPLAWRRASSLV